MKIFTLFAAAVTIVAGLLSQSAHADLITGSLGLSGIIMYNTSSAATATAATGITSAQVVSKSGSFAPVTSGTAATPTPNAWFFNSSTPIANFFSVSGFRFEMLTSFVISQSGSTGLLFVGGTGVVSGNGYTPTSCSWSLTSQDPKAGNGWTYSFSLTSKGSNGAPVLVNQKISNAMVFKWTDPTFVLQSATNISGPFSSIANATSPFTNPFTGTRLFFRLKQ